MYGQLAWVAVGWESGRRSGRWEAAMGWASGGEERRSAEARATEATEGDGGDGGRRRATEATEGDGGEGDGGERGVELEAGRRDGDGRVETGVCGGEMGGAMETGVCDGEVGGAMETGVCGGEMGGAMETDVCGAGGEMSVTRVAEGCTNVQGGADAAKAMAFRQQREHVAPATTLGSSSRAAAAAGSRAGQRPGAKCVRVHRSRHSAVVSALSSRRASFSS
jgi:hypothetical protein